MLGSCAADRPRGCDARRCGYVSLSIDTRRCSLALMLGRRTLWCSMLTRCSALARLIALVGVTLAAAAASA